jgi:hypothetical protein
MGGIRNGGRKRRVMMTLRYTLLLLCLLALSATAEAHTGALKIAIDWEEAPSPDLTRISNVYHGSAEYVYAFLVVKSSATGYIDAYDVGYRLICPDNSVRNHGFTRLAGWAALDPTATDFPTEAELCNAELPVAIGYWTVELKDGRRSRAELQITAN